MHTKTSTGTFKRTGEFRFQLFSALALVGLFSMLLSGVARADEVRNNVVAGGNDTIATAGTTTITYSIQSENANFDYQQGCNAADTTPMTLTPQVPANVIASPTALMFTRCGGVGSQSIKYSSSAAGNYSINVSISDAGVGTYTNSANFTLKVLPPPNTAPSSVAVTGFTNGSTYQLGVDALPTAGCVAEDAEDGTIYPTPVVADGRNPFGLGTVTASCSYSDGQYSIGPVSASYTVIDTIAPGITFAGKSPAANSAGWNNASLVTLNWTCSDSGSGVSSPVYQQSSTEGTTSLTGTCTDNAGNAVSDTQSVSIDSQLPVITAAADRGADSNGWYNAAVSIGFTCSDPAPGSGLLAASCPAAVIVATDTTVSGQNISGSVSDVAGNTGQSNMVNVKLDTTAPTLSAAADRAANANGWYNDDVTVSFACADALSGAVGNPASQTFSEGATQAASATCFDLAGNESASAGVSGINIDKTAPVNIAFNGSIGDGATYYAGYNVPAAPTCAASDALSGLDGGCVVTGYSASIGLHILTATSKDNAGNVTTSVLTYTVAPLTISGFSSPVDMNGTVNTVKAGATAPLKFEIFAGATELTSTGIVKFLAVKTSCQSGAAEDTLEVTSTGGTSLRYDATSGQYIQNWQTPKSGAGSCYTVTMTTSDGSTISANFKLK